MTFDPIREVHKTKDYSSFDGIVPVDELIARYALFPNEAIYIVDCEQTQMEPLTNNFEDIIGIDLPHKNADSFV